jgi:hypothetical protein
MLQTQELIEVDIDQAFDEYVDINSLCQFVGFVTHTPSFILSQIDPRLYQTLQKDFCKKKVEQGHWIQKGEDYFQVI